MLSLESNVVPIEGEDNTRAGKERHHFGSFGSGYYSKIL